MRSGNRHPCLDSSKLHSQTASTASRIAALHRPTRLDVATYLERPRRTDPPAENGSGTAVVRGARLVHEASTVCTRLRPTTLRQRQRDSILPPRVKARCA